MPLSYVHAEEESYTTTSAQIVNSLPIHSTQLVPGLIMDYFVSLANLDARQSDILFNTRRVYVRKIIEYIFLFKKLYLMF